MEFELTIKSQNAAFTGGGPVEVARLLRQVADSVAAGSDGGRLLDYNGNHCGSWGMDDEKPEFFEMEAAELFKAADDWGVALDDDPRKLSRAELIEGLESIGIACYDEESDELLAAAYGDSMMAGDLGCIDRTDWPDALEEEWNA